MKHYGELSIEHDKNYGIIFYEYMSISLFALNIDGVYLFTSETYIHDVNFHNYFKIIGVDEL